MMLMMMMQAVHARRQFNFTSKLGNKINQFDSQWDQVCLCEKYQLFGKEMQAVVTFCNLLNSCGPLNAVWVSGAKTNTGIVQGNLESKQRDFGKSNWLLLVLLLLRSVLPENAAGARMYVLARTLPPTAITTSFANFLPN